MEKLNLFLIIILCLTVFSSCQEDNEETTPKQNLVGKMWIITNSDTEISTSLGALPDTLTNDFDPTQNIKGQTITFNENGTFLVGEADNQQQGNWTLSEDAKTLTFTGFVEGDLTDITDAQTLSSLQTFDVRTLTDTKLEIENTTDIDLPVEITQELVGLPIPITITVKLNIVFDKK